MRIRKRITLLIVLCMCSIAVLVSADEISNRWKDARDHKRWTQWMLFGNPSYSSYKKDDIKTAVKQLHDAVLLCIDQCNGNYADKIEELSFIQGVPDSLVAIDFKANNWNENESHRVYTHRGWNFKYNNFLAEKSHPDIRKQILNSVVEHVFHFSGFFQGKECTDKCDAMSCLLYNMHIIEDRYHSAVWHGAANTLLLTDTSSRTASVTHDLLHILPTLFSYQKKDTHYLDLRNGIQSIAEKIIAERKIGDTTELYLKIDRKYAEELRDLLGRNLPALLANEQWFANVFPPKWGSSIY